MDDEGRGDEDCRSSREVNYEAKVPKHQVTTVFMFEVPQRGNGAPGVREVVVVCVGKRHSLLPQVDRATGKGAYVVIVWSTKRLPKSGRVASAGGFASTGRVVSLFYSLYRGLHVLEVSPTVTHEAT